MGTITNGESVSNSSSTPMQAESGDGNAVACGHRTGSINRGSNNSASDLLLYISQFDGSRCLDDICCEYSLNPWDILNNKQIAIIYR